MADFVLKKHFFEFNDEVNREKSGTAIGTKYAPLYACIFMDEIEACFRLNGKKAILSLVTKKATNKTLKITVQFLYYLSAEKVLKDSYLMKCLVSF